MSVLGAWVHLGTDIPTGTFSETVLFPAYRAVTGVQLLVPLVSATYALSPYLVEQQQPQGMGKHV